MLVGGKVVVLLNAGLCGVLLLTAVTMCESLAWLIALRFHAGGIAKAIIIVTLAFSWVSSLATCMVGVGAIYLLYTLCKTVFYYYNWDRIEYARVRAVRVRACAYAHGRACVRTHRTDCQIGAGACLSVSVGVIGVRGVRAARDVPLHQARMSASRFASQGTAVAS